MRDGTEESGTELFGVRIVDVEGPQNVVANCSHPCGIHVVQCGDHCMHGPGEWGDGPLDGVDLVTRVQVPLETKNTVIPQLCTQQ
jgi:hypothetical protein